MLEKQRQTHKQTRSRHKHAVEWQGGRASGAVVSRALLGRAAVLPAEVRIMLLLHV